MPISLNHKKLSLFSVPEDPGQGTLRHGRAAPVTGGQMIAQCGRNDGWTGLYNIPVNTQTLSTDFGRTKKVAQAEAWPLKESKAPQQEVR